LFVGEINEAKSGSFTTRLLFKKKKSMRKVKEVGRESASAALARARLHHTLNSHYKPPTPRLSAAAKNRFFGRPRTHTVFGCFCCYVGNQESARVVYGTG
jgi:hypothetical protein